ncbi:MAG: hypothetical protein ABH841_01605 [Candidatus Nealsonbacteria bacterium]
MRITFQAQENIQNIMRRCGYFFTREERGEMAFVRPLTSAGSGYPRFHAYIKVDDVSRETQINLHLDQKKPIYNGATAHSGEYDGNLVVNETERLKKILGL